MQGIGFMVVLTVSGRFSRWFLRLAPVAVVSALLAACGSTVTSTEPTLDKCTFTLTAPASAISPAGGSEQVVLTTTPECAWTASADASWVARIEPSSGQGSRTLRVDVAPNPSPFMRQASIVVNGVRAQIQQGPAACEYAVSGSGAQSVGASGGSFQATVTTTAGCPWAATVAVNWLRVTSGSPGNGSGVVEFSVDANAGAQRVADVTIAGQPFLVTQAGAATPTPPCTYLLSPTTLAVPAVGGGGPPLSLTTTCAWSATTNVPWITITSPNGSGSASIGFTVAPNNGPARSGTISAGSATTTINQATGCSISLNPNTIGAPVSASTGAVSVSTAASCDWTAISGASWITITSGATGSGNGTIGYSVAANTGAARSGTISVGSATTTINQVACSFSVSPTSVNTRSDAINVTINVTTSASCVWSASSGVPWITLTSGAFGSGNGATEFKISTNLGAARSGTLTVAGQPVAVTQAEAPPD